MLPIARSVHERTGSRVYKRHPAACSTATVQCLSIWKPHRQDTHTCCRGEINLTCNLYCYKTLTLLPPSVVCQLLTYCYQQTCLSTVPATVGNGSAGSRPDWPTASHEGFFLAGTWGANSCLHRSSSAPSKRAPHGQHRTWWVFQSQSLWPISEHQKGGFNTFQFLSANIFIKSFIQVRYKIVFP